MKIEAPVFIVGWFRSGTSMVWNMFRESGKYTCYYEPLHPHLKLYLEEDYRAIDTTHDGLEDYWREYRALSRDEFIKCWKPWFGRERWHLGTAAEAEDLKSYLEFLQHQSDKPAVFKFVRAGFRIEWLRNTFPNAHIIHVARNPRSVWTSMMGRECVDDSDEVLLSDRGRAWSITIQAIARELGFREREHPYQQFFELWSTMYRKVETYADETWWYEDIVEGGESWMQQHLIEPGYLDKPYPVAISPRSLEPGIHPNSWYWNLETSVTVGDDQEIQPASGVQAFDNAVYEKKISYLQDRCEELGIAYKNLSIDQMRLLEDKATAIDKPLAVYLIKLFKLVLKNLYKIRKIS